MMKRNVSVLLILFMLMPIGAGFAQEPVSAIDILDIEIWPDYDRPAVLVLLTGTLPSDTRLPASITLSLPGTARLNAVARIDGNDGVMKDDIFSDPDPSGRLTFITPDLRFRVEYYLPYSVNDNQRSFDYSWLAAITVNNLQLRVQRPTSASTLNSDPPAANIVRSGDGFDYHIFPARAVPAGQPFSLQVDYHMTNAQLSAASLPAPNTGGQSSALSVPSSTGPGINWALVAIVTGGLIIAAALIWQIASRRPAPNIRDIADARIKKNTKARFCRNCGESIDQGDRFCGGCGSKL